MTGSIYEDVSDTDSGIDSPIEKVENLSEHETSLNCAIESMPSKIKCAKEISISNLENIAENLNKCNLKNRDKTHKDVNVVGLETNLLKDTNRHDQEKP